jgi:bacterioferritin
VRERACTERTSVAPLLANSVCPSVVRRLQSHGASTKGAAMTTMNQDGPFLTDVKELRRRAREHIENGAVTEHYRADRETVVKLLNEALATEIVCVLRYKRHYFMAQGLEAKAVADEFLEHANEEQGHADEIARRIVQLNGEPNLNPEGMTSRSHSEYVEGQTLVDMIREDLIAERVAIDSYTEIIRYLGDDDITSKRMLEGILAKEEEHAEDLAGLLAAHTPAPSQK